jgi:hypothetical protein
MDKKIMEEQIAEIIHRAPGESIPYPDRLKLADRIKELMTRAEAAEAKVALWMSSRGYATGHGDTVEDMLVELEGQAKERALRERR